MKQETRERRQKVRDYQRRNPLAYGGELRNTRAGRARPRPLSNRQGMHLILRATRAKGALSFRQPRHAAKIEKIVKRFSAKYRVKILSLANVGNHLHFHALFQDYNGYKPFIRAVTAAIAMAVTGANRWNKAKEKFWDYRPFTRLVTSRLGHLRLTDYIEINKLEGLGIGRAVAEILIARERGPARGGSG